MRKGKRSSLRPAATKRKESKAFDEMSWGLMEWGYKKKVTFTIFCNEKYLLLRPQLI